jgi:hypothetical protein
MPLALPFAFDDFKLDEVATETHRAVLDNTHKPGDRAVARYVVGGRIVIVAAAGELDDRAAFRRSLSRPGIGFT